MKKNEIELLEEFAEYGYVIQYCPKCKSECYPTEIDNPEAYCETCDDVVLVGSVI